MALLWMDGFDHYSSSAGFPVGLSGAFFDFAASGRLGGQAWRFNNTGSSVTFANQLPVSATTFILGFAFASGGVNNYFMGIFNNTPSKHASLRHEPDGRVGLYDAGGSQVGVTSATFSAGTWHYYELKMTIGNSAAAILRIDGVQVISVSGQDFYNAGSTDFSRFGMGVAISQNGQGIAGTVLDDMYLCDTTGGAPWNDFLGDVRIETVFPTGNGNSSQWVGSDSNSTDNYLLVDENPPNTSDYVESSTVNDTDTYVMGDVVTTSGAVYGVQLNVYCAKNDAGTRIIRPVIRRSGTDYAGNQMTLGSGYEPRQQLYTLDPSTSSQWNIAGVNAMEVGVKVDT